MPRALSLLALASLFALGCKSRTVVEIAAGKDNTCLRTQPGRIYCWGDDAYMQTKDAAFATRPGPRNTPKRVAGLEDARDVSLAASHGCAAVPNGGIRCFLDVDLEPASVAGFEAKQVSASTTGVCGVSPQGDVKCYLADARELPRKPVTLPSALGKVQSLAAGERHVCAVLEDGTVACWGEFERGQLGPLDDEGRKPNALAKIAGLKDVSALAAGSAHTCALLKNGRVWCWGMNESGELGRAPDMMREPVQPVPAEVAGVEGATAIAAGYYHTCAVVQGGAVMCWGSNVHGELGRPPLTKALFKPERVEGITGAVQVACGEQHSCALVQGGAIKCWGRNNRGQLGDGTNTDSTRPVDVKLP